MDSSSSLGTMSASVFSLILKLNDIRNISIQLNNIYMTLFLEIKRYRDFNSDVLPKIDALAADQNRTRSDIIRDILCEV